MLVIFVCTVYKQEQNFGLIILVLKSMQCNASSGFKEGDDAIRFSIEYRP